MRKPTLRSVGYKRFVECARNCKNITFACVGLKRTLNDNLPTLEPLIFPRGVRFPQKDEIPGDPSEVLERVSRAKITTGYTLQAADGQPYKTYIEANVHAPNVFDVFRKLAFALLPDVAAPLIGIKEDQPVFGPYTDRAWALGVFEPYVDVLQNDGFLEFGLIHQSEFGFEEIFVTSTKYLKIWTNAGSAAEAILNSAGIPKCESLEFIDEYPMVSLSVGDDGNAAWARPFHAIQDEFLRLPQPFSPENDQ